MNNDYLSSFRLRSNTNTNNKVKDSERMKYEMDGIGKSNFPSNDIYNLNHNRHLFNTSYKENTLTDNYHNCNMTFSNYNTTKTSNFDYTPSIRNKTMKHTLPFSNEKFIRHANDQVENSLQMMNFKINFDILKSKIARLNSLVPSANNSYEYSHFTSSSEQNNQNCEIDQKYNTRLHMDLTQQNPISFNKIKLLNEQDYLGSYYKTHYNTDNYSLLYNNNSNMLESKTNHWDKRKERENVYYNEGIFNNYNIHINKPIGNNDYKNTNTIADTEPIVDKATTTKNSNHNKRALFSNKPNRNFNKAFLNNSNNKDLLRESVNQFAITPMHLTERISLQNIGKNNLSPDSNSKCSQKIDSNSSSLNLSDIVDDIIKIKNTPAKPDVEIVDIKQITQISLNKNLLDGFELNKDLCNADTTKGSNLQKDLYNRNHKNIYGTSKEEGFFRNIEINEIARANSNILENINCINVEYIGHSFFNETEINKESQFIHNEPNSNNLPVSNVDSNLSEIKNESNPCKFEVNLKSMKINKSLGENSLENVDVSEIKENKFQEIDGHDEMNHKYEKNSEIHLQNYDNEMDCSREELNIEEDTEHKKKNENYSSCDRDNMLINNIDNNLEIHNAEDNQEDKQIILDPEDEDDNEADLILNEIIKNSKLKYEQQQKSQNDSPVKKNDEVSSNIHKDKIIHKKQEDFIFTNNEMKIDLKENEMQNYNIILEKSLDDSIILEEAAFDPNLEFDIKDQLCGEKNSLNIIEDIIERSMEELSFSKDLGERIVNYPNREDESIEENEEIIINVPDKKIQESEKVKKTNLKDESSQVILNLRNLSADFVKKEENKNIKAKKAPFKKNVAIVDKVTTITYEHKSYVPNLFLKKRDGRLIKIKKRDIEEYMRKLYKNKKPKSILKKPKVDEKEVALKRLNDLISEYDNSKISETETGNMSKSVSIAERKRIEVRNKKFIQQIETAHKSGKKLKSLNPKVTTCKKKNDSENFCKKFKSNPQKFFSNPPCSIVLKSLKLKDQQISSKESSDNKRENINDDFTQNKARKFNSEEQNAIKLKKEKILMDIINNINIEDKVRDLELDSKVLTHQTFSNLSFISNGYSENKDFFSKAPDEEISLYNDLNDFQGSN